MKKIYALLLSISCLLALTNGCGSGSGSGSGGGGSQENAAGTVYAAPVKDAAILVHREALTTEKQAELGTTTTFEVGHSDDHGNIIFDQTALSYVASYPVVVFAEHGVLYASQYTTLAEAEAAGASEDIDIFHGYLADVLDSPTGEVHLSPAAAIVARLFTLSTNHDLDDLHAAQDIVKDTIITEMGLNIIPEPLGDPTENMSGYEAIYQSLLYAMGLTEHSDCEDCVAVINECAEALRNTQQLWSVVKNKHIEFASETNLQAALNHNSDAIKSGAQEALGKDFDEEKFQQEMPEEPVIPPVIPSKLSVTLLTENNAVQENYTLYTGVSEAEETIVTFSCKTIMQDGSTGSFKVTAMSSDMFSVDDVPIQNNAIYTTETSIAYIQPVTEEDRYTTKTETLTIVPLRSDGEAQADMTTTITITYHPSGINFTNHSNAHESTLFVFDNAGDDANKIQPQEGQSPKATAPSTIELWTLNATPNISTEDISNYNVFLSLPDKFKFIAASNTTDAQQIPIENGMIKAATSLLSQETDHTKIKVDAGSAWTIQYAKTTNLTLSPHTGLGYVQYQIWDQRGLFIKTGRFLKPKLYGCPSGTENEPVMVTIPDSDIPTHYYDIHSYDPDPPPISFAPENIFTATVTTWNSFSEDFEASDIPMADGTWSISCYTSLLLPDGSVPNNPTKILEFRADKFVGFEKQDTSYTLSNQSIGQEGVFAENTTSGTTYNPEESPYPPEPPMSDVHYDNVRLTYSSPSQHIGAILFTIRTERFSE
ncbi:MAG: hypothetical protein MI749_20510 [Desulfovibrionales bacterium]|nr:hypothetical protein [Desulfovibrionales bacterium]